MADEISRADSPAGPCGPGGEGSPVQGCPMAAMCKEFAGAPQARWGPTVLGVLFLVVGVLILVQPGFLVWLAGITTMVLGLLCFAGGVAMRRFVQKIECCQPS